MSGGDPLRLATRGSDLALRQAGTVRDRLAGARRDVDLVEVETTGDQIRDELIHRLGTTGAFARSLDEAVLDGRVDAAVHSLKDLPTEHPDRLVVAAVPRRADPRDVLVTPDGADLDSLPEGATVGTSSLRRRAQLLAERPDLEIEPLRGNVDTRCEKLLAPSLQREHERRLAAEEEDGADGEDGAEGDEDDGDPATADGAPTTVGGDGADEETGNEHGFASGEGAGIEDADELPDYEQSVQAWFDGLSELERQALGREVDVEYDAIVLARAGLERAGLLNQIEATPLSPSEFVPAPGQGALAVTAVDGELARDLRSRLDDPPTRVETTVERTILAELGGGCVAPLGVHAVLEGSVVRTTVRVLSRDGTETVAGTRELPVQRHPEAAREFAAELADRGAADLVERAKREADEAAGSDDSDDAGEADEADAVDAAADPVDGPASVGQPETDDGSNATDGGGDE